MGFFDKLPLVKGAKKLFGSEGTKEFLLGGKDKNKQLTTKTPEQEELLRLITEGLTEGTGPLADLFKSGFDEKAFEKGVTQPALKNFQENILPMVQEGFISRGQSGGSALRRGQLKAGVDLQSRLAELMYQAQNQQQQQQSENRLRGAQLGLGTGAFENLYKPGKKGIVPGFVEGIGQGIGRATGAAIAG